MVLKKIIKSPFFAGSVVMVLGTNIYNFGQFVFHFLSGRLLGKALYGDVAALISILGLLGIVQLSINLTIVKYIASAKTEREISRFTKWIYVFSVKVGIVLSLLVLLASPLLTSFMNISDVWSVALLAPIMFFFLLGNSLRAVLQGMLRFGAYVASLTVESVVKIALMLVLIYAGLSVLGAVGGMLIGTFVSFLVAYRALGKYLRIKNSEAPDIASLASYTLPVFLQGLALTSMYSTDLILVKHFFSPETAGMYASLAVLGRVVFFGTSPVTQVMFPIVAKKHTRGEPYQVYLFLSLAMVVIFSIFVVFMYALVPKLAIGVLYGAEYLDGAVYLWWFAVFMGLLGVSVNLIQFYLSIGRTRVVALFIVAAIVQAVGIVLYHPTVLSVIQVSIAASGLLSLGLLLYFPYSRHQNK